MLIEIAADILYALLMTGLVAFSFLGIAAALVSLFVLLTFVALTWDAHVGGRSE